MNQTMLSLLRQARLNKGYTQEDIANKLGVKKNTISNYENGVSEPDMETYIKMCEYYETDPTDILRQAYPNTIYSDIDYLKYIPPNIRKVVEAYLNQSEMQPAVDKLLGIEDTDKTEDNMNANMHKIQIAAYGGGISEHEITQEQHEKAKEEYKKLKFRSSSSWIDD